MRNYALIIFAFIFLFFPGRAHSQEGDVYVSLGAGASIPFGEYASTDFDDEASGFARPGGNFNIAFGYRFNEYISLTGLLNGCVNRYDYVKVQEWLTEQYAQALPDTRWVVESKSWGTGGLMGGITGSLPLVTNRFFLEARALGGFLYAYSPAVYITGEETGSDDKVLDIEQSTAASWVLDLGAGFRYNRTHRQYFILMADYEYAEPYFKDVLATGTNIEMPRSDAFRQQMSTINVSIGIGYIVN